MISSVAVFKQTKKTFFSQSHLQPPRLTWHEYLEDEFYNITWRWVFRSDQLKDISSFCQRCDFRVFPQRSNMYDEFVHFTCGNCNSQLQKFDKSFEQVKHDIVLRIEHNIRTGKWKEIVERQIEISKTKSAKA